MAAPRQMPARGHATAPTFDPSQPRTLRRYFADLEVLFTSCQIAADLEKKQAVAHYTDIDTSELIESQIEYSDPTKTYADLKAALLKLYPGAEEERKYTNKDLEALISIWSQRGIHSASDLGSYHRDFLTITRFLISKSRLSTLQQGAEFVRAFSGETWSATSSRLQLKLPDHHPDDPYSVEHVFEAAAWVLNGTLPSTFRPTIMNPAPASTTSASTSNAATVATSIAPKVKNEDMIQTLGRALAAALSMNNTRPPPPFQRGPGYGPPRNVGGAPTSYNENGPVYGPPQADPNRKCYYDGCDRSIKDCLGVQEDIDKGLVRLNTWGRVALPGGGEVPRNLPGAEMRHRVYEWHRRNPDQHARGQLMFGVYPSNAETYQLSTHDRIASLERELSSLRNADTFAGRVFDGVHVPPYRRAAAPAASRPPPPPPAQQPPAPASQPSIPQPPPPAQPRNLSPPVVPRAQPPLPPPGPSFPPSNARPPAPPPVAPAPPPFHPFAGARDASYAPPQARNVGAPPPKPPVGRDFAYRSTAPVQQPHIAEDVFKRSMAASCITLTPAELLSLSPEVRQKYREAVTPKRAPAEASAHILDLVDDNPFPFAESSISDHTATFENYLPSPDELLRDGNPPPGVFVIPDPYEAYLRNLQPGQAADSIVVAKESHALRSLHSVIDNKDSIECIIDPGSQVVSMSEEVCHHLGLVYDPSVRIQMQSANKGLDLSLGLAHNVPFQFGDITVYMQVHIIRETAYDVLLGRPFDVNTTSIVQNFANEEQTITIHDPNSNRIATVPTQPRGLKRFTEVPPKPKTQQRAPPEQRESPNSRQEPTQQDFHSSRI